MPRPTDSDPDLCVTWGNDNYERVPDDRADWWVHADCGRALRTRGRHRIRCRTTASMDRLYDGLVAYARERSTR